MLQTLRKKSKKALLLKIKLRNFVKKQLLTYLIVFASIILCSWLFDKWIEGIMFCIAHTCVRNSFDKQFHFDNNAYCIMLTLFIIWLSISITLPVSLSLLSSIPIAFLIAYVGYLVQDNKDMNAELKNFKNRKNIYSMTEKELYDYCREQGLDDVECKIAYFLIIEGLKGKELYDAIGYSPAQAKRKRKKILSRLT